MADWDKTIPAVNLTATTDPTTAQGSLYYNGAALKADMRLATNQGGTFAATVDAATVLTATELSDLQAILDKLQDAAYVAAGFTVV